MIEKRRIEISKFFQTEEKFPELWLLYIKHISNNQYDKIPSKNNFMLWLDNQILEEYRCTTYDNVDIV